MRFVKAIIISILLITTPATLAYPHGKTQTHRANLRLKWCFREAERYHLVTYDDVLELLNEIESGVAEKKYRKKDLKRIDHFLAYLVDQGKLPNSNLALNIDIQDLLSSEMNFGSEACFIGLPLLFSDFWACKTKNFIKKYKKEIIIGAIVVITATVIVIGVIMAPPVGAAVLASAGAAASSGATLSKREPSTHENAIDPQFTSAIDTQVLAFKENLNRQEFFEQKGLSIEETGRVLGTVFAHEAIQSYEKQFSTYSQYADGVQKQNFSIADFDARHRIADQNFSSNYSSLFHDTSKEINFNAASYHLMGEKALSLGNYPQAIQDFGKAIEFEPASSHIYLERGTAYFQVGDYDRSLEDFHQYASSQDPKTYPHSISEFSLGFAKGLPRGVYESGEGILLFLADLVKDPIHTAGQMLEALTMLSKLTRSDEWGVIAEALAPEIHQLVTEWDTIPSSKRGELAGYALGKYGADIVMPGALVKVASKSAKSARELAAVCKNLKRAEETLILETAAGLGSGAKVAEIVEAGQTTIHLGEELGFNTRAMAKLKQEGKLESILNNTLEQLTPEVEASIAIHKKAQDALKIYKKIAMPEEKARELIHAVGISTFPRPRGIPENYIVRITNKGTGMEYIHPTNTHRSVRVMPGKPYSPLIHQQKPYVVQMKDGKAFDKHGNLIPHDSPEAHIPVNEFIYRR